nr:nucleotide-binding alpha-beta plait domain-containing protein [Tanacetum cinerariifolium]
MTNFPESMSAKKLFHACIQYGHVVDSFIPTKKSKNGKRFGFVRFINVFNEERLVNNLSTIWIDRYKIQANIARFQRPTAKKDEDGGKKTFTFPVPKEQLKSKVIPGGGNSYMGALKREDDVARISTSVYMTNFLESMSAKKLFHACSQYGHVVDSFIPTKKSKNGKRFGFVRVKEFASLANLKLALGNEGFGDITIKYIGELWVLLEFKSEESKNKFKDNVIVVSWFSEIIKASTNFEVEGRIAWVEVEGVTFKLWSGNTFSRIANKYGKLLDVDDQEETLKYPHGYTPFDGTNEKTDSDKVQKCEDLKTGNKEEVNDAYSDC